MLPSKARCTSIFVTLAIIPVGNKLIALLWEHVYIAEMKLGQETQVR